MSASKKYVPLILVDALTEEAWPGAGPTVAAWDEDGNALDAWTVDTIGGGMFGAIPVFSGSKGSFYVATAPAGASILGGGAIAGDYVRPEDYYTDLLSISPAQPDAISALRLRIASSQVASIVDALAADLTSARLRALQMQPLIVGDDWQPRFLILDGGATVDLTAAAILSTLRMPNGTSVMTRSTGVDIEGSSPSKLQIEIDDQGTDNGSGGTTGRGWFTMRFGHETADVAALQAALAATVHVVGFDVKVTIANATRTRLRGVIEIVPSIS